ncbi:universal stress protein [Malaciobacter canalis]|uniref:universal stress protein n=1 Tax=Malaciobacter canalis TaxID=1912871 RepID=UPI0038505FCD
MGYVLCCIDGKNYSYSACDYAVKISNNMNLPLKFLNIVVHNHYSSKIDLSGSIVLGERDDILQELAKEEEEQSKSAIKSGKEILNELKQRASQTCNNEVIISQIHGEVIDNILELEDEIEALVIGIKSKEEHEIGDNVKEIIRNIHKPVLLVNSDYVEPKKLLVAYNGSSESKKLLQQTSSNPLFKDVKRDIVNLNTNKIESATLLQEAKEIYSKKGYEVETKTLDGTSEDLLINYFNENNCDILAMGAFGHSRVKEFIFGSFTSKVLSKMKKPLLLFR